MSYIANLDRHYPGFFKKHSNGQLLRMSHQTAGSIKGACHSCNMVSHGLACEELFRSMSVGSGDCWHPVGTLLVRGEVAEWARE